MVSWPVMGRLRPKTGSRAGRLSLALLGAVAAAMTLGAAGSFGPRLAALPVPGDAQPATRADAPAPGRFLIATRQVASPIFARSVILLLDYGPGGAFGLIVNRPTTLPLASLMPDDEAMRARADPIYVGGPVVADGMMLLIRANEAPTDSRKVVSDIYVTGSSRALRAVVEQKVPPTRFHAYVGYSGWGPGQLDDEIARGDWYVAAASADVVFAEAVSGTWQNLISQYEGVQVRRGGPAGAFASFPRLQGAKLASVFTERSLPARVRCGSRPCAHPRPSRSGPGAPRARGRRAGGRGRGAGRRRSARRHPSRGR